MTIEVIKGDQVPRESGLYVCWIAGVIVPDVCYYNRRDDRWSRDGVRCHVSYYEDRKLQERKP